jgi:hypothetical protein
MDQTRSPSAEPEELLLSFMQLSTSFFPEGLTGFRKMISDWGIDWDRFIDMDVRNYDGMDGEKGNKDRQRRLRFAYRIDTSVLDR